MTDPIAAEPMSALQPTTTIISTCTTNKDDCSTRSVQASALGSSINRIMDCECASFSVSSPSSSSVLAPSSATSPSSSTLPSSILSSSSASSISSSSSLMRHLRHQVLAYRYIKQGLIPPASLINKIAAILHPQHRNLIASKYFKPHKNNFYTADKYGNVQANDKLSSSTGIETDFTATAGSSNGTSSSGASSSSTMYQCSSARALVAHLLNPYSTNNCIEATQAASTATITNAEVDHSSTKQQPDLFSQGLKECFSAPKREKDIAERKELLEILHDPKMRGLYDRFVYMPEGVRKRAELERRILALNSFQAKLRKKVLHHGRRSNEPCGEFILNADIPKAFYKPHRLVNSVEASNSDSSMFNLFDVITNSNNENASTSSNSSSSGICNSRNSSSNDVYLRGFLGTEGNVNAALYAMDRAVYHTRVAKTTGPQQLVRLKYKVHFMRIPKKSYQLREIWSKKKSQALKLTQAAASHIAAVALRKQQLREKEQRERMRVLRENDMDKYMELVNQTKNKRLQELMSATDGFLKNLGARVTDQREATEALIREREIHQINHYNPPPSETIETIDTASSGVNGGKSSSSNDDNKIDCNEENTTTLKLNVRNTYYSLSHRIQERVITQPSCLLGGKLMSYQMIGLEWLVSLYNNNLNGILADEMGLGKTVQTIALIGFLKHVKNNVGPHLIIVPLSTLPNWTAEFNRWCPDITILQYRGARIERRPLLKELKAGNYNVCLTTYDFIIREKAPLSKPHWKHIVVDEGHRLKNTKSRFHIILNDFKCTHRLLLTGTPLQNNLAELWALLNFLLPRIFSSADDFQKWFSEPFSGSGMTDPNDKPNSELLNEEEEMIIINRLHSVLRPFLLRRIKADVLEDLPDKLEFVIRVELSHWQKIVYKQLQQKGMRILDADGTVSKKSYQNTMMQLRKIVNHPYLFCDEYNINRDIYRVSGKFELLDRMLPKLLQFKHKVLIFCQMTQLMEILGDYLDYRGLKYHRLDGAVAINDRQDRMLEFNSLDGGTQIFILSTRAGGLGINLQAADTVILFDSDFNPHQDLQAQCRAHRVGQKNEVRVFRLVTISGVEELVMQKAQHKLDLDDKIIQAGMFSTRYTEEERDEKLRNILTMRDLRKEVRPTTPEELNRYMARNEKEEEYFDEYDKRLFDTETNDFFSIPELNCNVHLNPVPPPNESNDEEANKSVIGNDDEKGDQIPGEPLDSPPDAPRSDDLSFEAGTASSNANQATDASQAANDNAKSSADSTFCSNKTELEVCEGNRDTGSGAEDDNDNEAANGSTSRNSNSNVEGSDGPNGSTSARAATSEEIERLLVESERLMRASEIPFWVVQEFEEETNPVEETDDDDDDSEEAQMRYKKRRLSRRTNQRAPVAYADTLTEAQFLRAVERYETGEVENLQSELMEEMRKAEDRKARRLAKPPPTMIKSKRGRPRK